MLGLTLDFQIRQIRVPLMQQIRHLIDFLIAAFRNQNYFKAVMNNFRGIHNCFLLSPGVNFMEIVL
jgi:hypothetical protein